MVSGEHESQIALAKLDPGLAAWLLVNQFEEKMPVYQHARPQATDVRVLVPRTYHADGMLVYYDEADRPVLAVVLEVQRGWDQTKRRTWPLYVAQLEAEVGVNVALIVYCPDPALARRYRDLFSDDGISLRLRPLIFTPEEIPPVADIEVARANPSLAVLSVLCHAGDPDVDAMFPAVAAALQTLSPNRAILYDDIVLAGLPEAARVRWEAFMSTTVGYQWHSEKYRKAAAEGEARGEARAVLTVLQARGVAVPADVRERILACTDLTELETWLQRAGTATAIDDVIYP
jgi:hypothetical protein